MRDPLAPLASARHLVGDRLTAAVTRVEARLASVGPERTDLTATAHDLLAGGKRLRAEFCAGGWIAAGGPPPSDATAPPVAAGAAVELFQAAALVHDDVMDGSSTRRGHPSAHRRYATLHEERGWQGSADRFGEAAAILLGDFLLVMSFAQVADATRAVAPASARRAQQVYDLMTAEVTLGQYADMAAQALPWDTPGAVDLDRAARILRAKSARYSVEHPLVLGAALAGGEPPLLDGLAAFGLPVGEAFQLRDDLLGVFGDPEVTGKPAGDDLREGKRTILLGIAVQRADGAQTEVLRAGVGRPDLDLAGIEAIREVLVDTGAVRDVEDRIAQRTEAAFRALRDVGLPADDEQILASLARLAVDRVA
jgi:geranylgeranyl diphosphate synthase, type I